MFIRTLNGLVPGIGEIRTPQWSEPPAVAQRRWHGSQVDDAILEAGLDQIWWYRNHLETVYCPEGEGVLEDLNTHTRYDIKAGTLYALDKHERYRLRVTKRMRVICTFVPPPSEARITTQTVPIPGPER